MFSRTIRYLKAHAAALKVAHPLMLRAIAAAKKKNARINELRQPMNVWFYSRIETGGREANTTRCSGRKEITPALLPSASGELFAS